MLYLVFSILYYHIFIVLYICSLFDTLLVCSFVLFIRYVSLYGNQELGTVLFASQVSPFAVLA